MNPRAETGLWKLPPLWTSDTDRSPTAPWKTLRVSHSSHSPNRRSLNDGNEGRTIRAGHT